jgi:hypothetical protein
MASPHPRAIAVLAAVYPAQSDLDIGKDPYCSGGQLSLNLDLRHSTTLPQRTVQHVAQLILAEATVLPQPSFQPGHGDRVRFLQDGIREGHVSPRRCSSHPRQSG